MWEEINLNQIFTKLVFSFSLLPKWWFLSKTKLYNQGDFNLMNTPYFLSSFSFPSLPSPFLSSTFSLLLFLHSFIYRYWLHNSWRVSRIMVNILLVWLCWWLCHVGVENSLVYVLIPLAILSKWVEKLRLGSSQTFILYHKWIILNDQIEPTVYLRSISQFMP